MAPRTPGTRYPFAVGTSHSRVGPFKIERRLAVGGMAEVFLATTTTPAGNRSIVVKRMLPHVANDPANRALFQREARLGSFIKHANVVELIASGEAEGALPFLILEYVPGCDLYRLLRSLRRDGVKLDPSLAAYVGCEILKGVRAVHEAVDALGKPLKIVHRDLSPSNIFLSLHGDVKVGDLGIARAEESTQDASSPGKGKLGYLSPEQVLGYDTTARSDLFACGAIIAELLIGDALFAAESELSMLMAIRDADISRFSDAARALPRGLAAVVSAALTKDPAARIASAAELHERLVPFATLPEAEAREVLRSLVSRATGDEPPQTTPLFDVSAYDQALRTPATISMPPMMYLVRADGRNFDPMTYAQLVEAIATGEIGLTDEIAEGLGAFQPISALPGLARHVPMSTLAPEPMDPPHDNATYVFDMQGGGFVQALAWCAAHRETGLITCEHSGVQKEVYVHEGVPRFVSSNIAGELLGEFLVRKHIIGRSELDLALAVLSRYDGQLGEAIVGLGLIEAVDMFRLISEQVKEKVLDLFRWTRGGARFFRGVEAPPNKFPVGLNPWTLLDEGVARRAAEGLPDATVPSHAIVVRRPVNLTTLDLPDAARSLVGQLQAPTSLNALATTLGTDLKRTTRLSVVLAHLGVIALELA